MKMVHGGRRLLLAIFGACILCSGVTPILIAGDKTPADTAQQPKKQTSEEAQKQSQRDLWTKLDTPVALEFEKGPLREVTNYLQDRHGLLILIDTEAFKEQSLADVESIETRVPKLANVKLGTALRLLLKPLQADFQVDNGFLTIVPKERMDPLVQFNRLVDATLN